MSDPPPVFTHSLTKTKNFCKRQKIFLEFIFTSTTTEFPTLYKHFLMWFYNSNNFWIIHYPNFKTFGFLKLNHTSHLWSNQDAPSASRSSPLKASKWKVVMFDKKISQLFPLPYFPPSLATIISFQAAPPAQNKRHIIQSIMGRGDYVDKSYSYACAGTPASSLSSLCQGVAGT